MIKRWFNLDVLLRTQRLSDKSSAMVLKGYTHLPFLLTTGGTFATGSTSLKGRVVSWLILPHDAPDVNKPRKYLSLENCDIRVKQTNKQIQQNRNEELPVHNATK